MIVVKIKSQHRRSPTVFSNNGNLAMECSVYRYSLRDGQLYLVGSGNLADGRGEMYSFDINLKFYTALHLFADSSHCISQLPYRT